MLVDIKTNMYMCDFARKAANTLAKKLDEIMQKEKNREITTKEKIVVRKNIKIYHKMIGGE